MFTIPQKGKLPQCPPANEWVMRMCYIYNGIVCHAEKGS